jgi:hypothetical protein
MDEIKAREILDEAVGPDCCGATLLSLRKKTQFEKPVSLERKMEMGFTQKICFMVPQFIRRFLSCKSSEDRVVRMRPWTFAWIPPSPYAGLNGMFTADELEAIAWWMRNCQNLIERERRSQ